ncbi:MAG TPA: hypothetical protein VGG75_14395 [Trebonia sp.]
MILWWRLRRWLLHPVDSCRWWWKTRHVPRPGDRVVDCRGRLSRVAAVDDDDVTLEDGYRCSWMHCCSWPE